MSSKKQPKHRPNLGDAELEPIQEEGESGSRRKTSARIGGEDEKDHNNSDCDKSLGLGEERHSGGGQGNGGGARKGGRGSWG